jgi:hypothetical protein
MIVLQRPPRAARSTRPSLERPMIPDSSAGPQSPMFQSSFKGALRVFQANAVLSTPLLPAIGPWDLKTDPFAPRIENRRDF